MTIEAPVIASSVAKITRIGRGKAKVIALPETWLTAWSLKLGRPVEEVEVFIRDGVLIISPRGMDIS